MNRLAIVQAAIIVGGASLILAAAVKSGQNQRAFSVEYLQGTPQQKERAFSPAVITEGGKTVWLAGQTTTQDLNGKSLIGDFEGQTRAVFALLDQTLKRAGGSLRNLVTMTVFINDPRNGDRFVQIRRETFPDGKFPASALITVSNFARPGILIEIQGVAVIGDK